MQIYRKLFNGKYSKDIFTKWIQIRKNVCSALNRKFTTDFHLENVFLTQGQADVLAVKSGFKGFSLDHEDQISNKENKPGKENFFLN